MAWHLLESNESRASKRGEREGGSEEKEERERRRKKGV
jgi:hypothetical protein